MKMFVSERREKIMGLLHEKKRITVQELHQNLGVSAATLRSDLNNMELEGLLTRTHGGAVLNDYTDNETSFSAREKKNKKEKELIATYARKFVEEKQCILLDASSTALELARALRNTSMRLTVVTNGIQTALELKENPSFTVVLIGGVLTKGSSFIEGTLGLNILDQVNIDIMFTSANGFSLEKGLTDFNLYEVQLKKEMIDKAKKVIALIDHSKIDSNSSAVFANIGDIDALITDKPVHEDFSNELSKNNIDVFIAK